MLKLCGMKFPQVFLVCSAVLFLAAEAGAQIPVSSFSTILTEVAERVGGDKVNVSGHIKPGVDPHEFDPKPSDLQVVSRSQLVLLSAKHMEGYVGKLKEATGGKVRIVEVGNQFPSLKLQGGHHHHGHGHKDGGHAHGHSHSVEDPHWWHSVANVQRAVRIVRDELTKISPADKAVFARNADVYLAELNDLQKWIRGKVAELPRNQRKLVTSHDAFQYFAKENGFTIYAVEGFSTTDQPSSKKVAEIIATIKKEGVKAIFPESIQNPKVLTEITRETGAKAGPKLYADGLGTGPAATYAGMMKHNVSAIVDSLK
jgi:zinc/manganese transport system substrate-binding protein